VPVIARPVGGVPEVAGDAALLVADRDPAVVAELLALAIGDDDLRTELRARGERRLDDYAYDRTAERIRAAVERVAC
jgi:glycosyltransferase involved in cell wall biosynthesis